MAQKDKYHDAVKRALIADGWDVTHDPYLLRFGRRRALIDFGAQPALGASRGTETIAVEVKTFASYSQLVDLEKALGSTSSIAVGCSVPIPSVSSTWPWAITSKRFLTRRRLQFSWTIIRSC